jgi:hypothetical protein
MSVELRRLIFRHFADTGAPPDLAREELDALAAQHAVVLDADGRIEFANPFATGPTDFLVTSGGRRWFGTCVWDALGILAALGADGQVDTHCRDCGETLRLEVLAGGLAETTGVVHFLVPAAQWYEDLRFT